LRPSLRQRLSPRQRLHRKLPGAKASGPRASHLRDSSRAATTGLHAAIIAKNEASAGPTTGVPVVAASVAANVVVNVAIRVPAAEGGLSLTLRPTSSLKN
jgi:hypothetical protein